MTINWANRTFLEPQERGVTELLNAISSGEQRIVFTSPTGTGKSLMMGYAISQLSLAGKRVKLRTNRNLLLDQLYENMTGFGLDVGVVASGRPELARSYKKIQLVMTQTELSRRKKRGPDWEIPPDIVFVDEAHNQWGGNTGELIANDIGRGAQYVSVTATPVGCPKDFGTLLIEAGKNSEFRRLGLLLPAMVYAPDEPEKAAQMRRTKTGEYIEGDVVKAIMTPTVYGRLIEQYGITNPDRLPSILFAPGVKESIWIAEKFYEAGIRSAHIDGENVWIDGKTHRKTQDLVDSIKWDSSRGSIRIVCNRFVLREGLDWTHLYHCVLATCFGSVQSYLQSVGRVLRAHDGLDHVILQDHGGNYMRHGSPNADREWVLGQTAWEISANREQQIREKKEKEPIVCPVCRAVRLSGPACVTCGHTHEVKGRYVVQLDGNLKFVRGDYYKERKVQARPEAEKHWDAVWYACKKSGKTARQAYGWFYKKHGYWPPKTLPNMPKNDADWFRPISSISQKDLTPRNP